MPSTRTDRAFGRGVRIAAGIAAVLVMIFMVVIVERDHPLKWDTHHNTPAVDRAAVQAGDAGPLPSTGIAPANTSGVVVHPGKTQSDLKP